MNGNVRIWMGAVLALAACAAWGGEDAQAPQQADLVKLLNDPPGTGLLVLFVAPDGQAAEHRMAVGDVLTHYAGKAVGALEDLQALAAEQRGEVEVGYLREGQARTVKVKAGKLGVNLVPVKKGQATELRPPATEVTFDFSKLEGAPRDSWYDFQIGGKKVGFEHNRLTTAGGRLMLRSTVAFDGGEQWGVNHFEVLAVATARPRPQILETHFTFVPTKVSTAGQRIGEPGQEPFKWHASFKGEKGPTSLTSEAPANTMADYLITPLASFMPREKGACWHYTVLSEAEGAALLPAGLFAAELEDVKVGVETRSCMRYEVHSMGRVTRSIWVDEKGQIVKNDYLGAQSVLVSKEAALQGLPESLKGLKGE
ncbi:MAG: PDZ domain-containing protein [Planctomycetota bacterium]|nr:PDZ domain-containing protein [Planctomycetota bacterium]